MMKNCLNYLLKKSSYIKKQRAVKCRKRIIMHQKDKFPTDDENNFCGNKNSNFKKKKGYMQIILLLNPLLIIFKGVKIYNYI